VGATVRWRLLLRVKDRDKALRLLDEEVVPRLGAGLRLLKEGRYWKTPELWECDIEQLLDAEHTPRAVYEALRKANLLGSGWIVHGPDEQGSWQFSGVFSTSAHGRASFAGLEWAQFEVSLQPASDAS
jgi:hypothetical protein